ncbi:MAG: dockerin type I repeat-containing protein [Planctomycetota bacterium]
MNLKTTTPALLLTMLLALPALAQHEDDAEIGHWNGQVAVGFDSSELFALTETSGVLTGWTGDEPGFVTLDMDEPAEELLAPAAGASFVLEVLSLDPALKAHTPGFASVLTAPGDSWTMGSPPFDDHPVWHIDSTDPGFNPNQTQWTAVFRINDVGTTGYAPSTPFTIVFTNPTPPGHDDDAEIGHWNGQVAVGFDSSEVFTLAETSGVLTGWTADEPGFVTLEMDEPAEMLLAPAAGANFVLEVVSLSPALKAHTPGFASVLTAPGDSWSMGSPPFDDHPVWHIDSTDPAFDAAQTEWTGVFRIVDTGTTAYTPSASFNIVFTIPTEHGHEDDAEIGHWNGQVAVGFDSSEVFSLEETTGLLTGWAGDEPGFVTVEIDEPGEMLLAPGAGAIFALEVVSLDPALQAHTPGFASVLTAPGDLWTMGSPPFDDHPVWHIDSTHSGFDPAQTEWTGTFRIVDNGTTAYAPSAPFDIVFTNLPPALPFIRGDANADGSRNVADAVFMLSGLFNGGDLGECQDALDANDDSAVNIADPVALLLSLFGASAPLPGPGPACGTDTTADSLPCVEHDACL